MTGARPSRNRYGREPGEKPAAWSAAVFTKFRRMWLQMPNVDIAVYAGYETKASPDSDKRFGHEALAMRMRFFNRGQIWLNLLYFTEEELVNLREILVRALDAAIPVARSIDEAARAELDAGAEDLSPRLFRMKPHLVLRELNVKPANHPDNKENNNGPIGSSQEAGSPASFGGQEPEHETRLPE